MVLYARRRPVKFLFIVVSNFMLLYTLALVSTLLATVSPASAASSMTTTTLSPRMRSQRSPRSAAAGAGAGMSSAAHASSHATRPATASMSSSSMQPVTCPTHCYAKKADANDADVDMTICASCLLYGLPKLEHYLEQSCGSDGVDHKHKKSKTTTPVTTDDDDATTTSMSMAMAMPAMNGCSIRRACARGDLMVTASVMTMDKKTGKMSTSTQRVPSPYCHPLSLMGDLCHDGASMFPTMCGDYLRLCGGPAHTHTHTHTHPHPMLIVVVDVVVALAYDGQHADWFGPGVTAPHW